MVEWVAGSSSSQQRVGKFMLKLRPSLTELAAGHSGVIFSKENENFQSFREVCRFPMHMSSMLQRYIYMLKCMNNVERDIETDSYIKTIIRCPILQKNVERTSVVSAFPLDVIHRNMLTNMITSR
jgi:hypothetical protein